MSSKAPSFINYINGKFIESEKCFLPVRDLAILRGYGCFDYFHTYQGKPVTLLQNVRRLLNSCKLIDLEVPWSENDLSQIVLETLKHNQELKNSENLGEINNSGDSGGKNFGIRIVVSGGVSSNNIIPDSEPTLVVLIEPVSTYLQHYYSEGTKVITVEMGRLFPTAKTTNYIPAIISQKKARKMGASEAIYLKNGLVQEGTTCNIFAFFGNNLITPGGDEILSGITRSIVIEISKKKFEVNLGEILSEDLFKADEIFLTSATRHVMPVVEVDGKKIGKGCPGENTKVIMKMFEEHMNQ